MIFAATSAAATPQREVEVRVDPRVELLGIIYLLGGHVEFSQSQVARYVNDVDTYFKPYESHPVVLLSQELRKTRGVSFDAVMQIALHIDDAFNPKPIRPLNDDSLMLYADGRWMPATADTFIQQLADFVKVSKFKKFYDDHEDLYEYMTQTMRQFVDANLDVKWIKAYFGSAPTEPFTVIPAMINGPASYGPKYLDEKGNEKFYAIIGINAVDDAGMPVIGSDCLEVIVHEFCHSFVNDLVEAHSQAFETPTSKMFEKVSSAMKRMAYPTWKIMTDESIVRAVVIRYFLGHHDEDTAKKRVEYEVKRSFLWMPQLSECLGKYERSREQYSTFDAYIPRIVEFFSEYAPTLDNAIAERKRYLEEHRPLIVSTEPANGAEGVDPATKQLILHFDRAMTNGYALAPPDSEVKGEQPETSNYEWNEDHTVLTMDIQLEPDAAYAFSLNTKDYVGFKSKDGIPLKPYLITFRTRRE